MIIGLGEGLEWFLPVKSGLRIYIYCSNNALIFLPPYHYGILRTLLALSIKMRWDLYLYS